MSIITPGAEASRQRKVNVALFGPAGIGKTTQLKTLSPETTLLIDLEAGDLALQDFPVDRIRVMDEAKKLGIHPWQMARALACILAGPDPTDQSIAPDGTISHGPYSPEAYEQYRQVLDPEAFKKYDTVFVDSLTTVSRWSFHFTQRNDPDAFSDKTGKPDTRGAYGSHGRAMIHWLTTLQTQPQYNVIVVGILDQKTDDIGRVTWEPQIVGGMAGRELPGIFDEVITMINVRDDNNGQSYRAFICHQDNPYAVPAKDRSGCLELLEPTDMGKLLVKVGGGQRLDNNLITTLPQQASADPSQPQTFMPAATHAADPAAVTAPTTQPQ